jgi:hypothetical protein
MRSAAGEVTNMDPPVARKGGTLEAVGMAKIVCTIDTNSNAQGVDETIRDIREALCRVGRITPGMTEPLRRPVAVAIPALHHLSLLHDLPC